MDSINAYWELTGKGIFKEEEMLRFLRYKSRDNARTPMQWDASPNAGFTEGEPWIMVNPNYGEINAADQIGRDDSVFSFYKELVKLRKEKPVVVNGEYRLLDPESEDVFVYERSFHEEHLLVVCSFSEKRAFMAASGGNGRAGCKTGYRQLSGAAMGAGAYAAPL